MANTGTKDVKCLEEKALELAEFITEQSGQRNLYITSPEAFDVIDSLCKMVANSYSMKDIDRVYSGIESTDYIKEAVDSVKGDEKYRALWRIEDWENSPEETKKRIIVAKYLGALLYDALIEVKGITEEYDH